MKHARDPAPASSCPPPEQTDPLDHVWGSHAYSMIDLTALAKNYALLKDKAHPAELAPVVKADGYGLGAQKIAPYLADLGAQTFFVANLEEGISLRAALGKRQAVIYILHGFSPSETDSFIQHSLRPVLNSLWQTELWEQLARQVSDLPPAALHINTGLNRLGLDQDEVEAFRMSSVQGKKSLPVTLILSHLACADTPQHPMNLLQLSHFRAALELLRPLYPKARASLANSAGLHLGPAWRFDLVRPGINLYGGHRAFLPEPLHPVVEVRAPVLQIRTIRQGDSVGYGAYFKARSTRKIATVGLGYADGFVRALHTLGFARIHGVCVPFTGRLSMDLITLDVTDVGEDVAPGMFASFLGPDLDILAKRANTEPYELLVRLNERCRRTYKL